LFFSILPQIEFEYDFRNLRADVLNYDKERDLFKQFPGKGRGSGGILMMNSREDIPSVRAWIKEKIKTDKTPTILDFMAFDDVWPFPKTQEKRMKIISEIKKIFEDDSIKLLKGEDKKNVDEIREYLNVEPYPLEDVPKINVNGFSLRGGEIGSLGYIRSRRDLPLHNGRNAIQFAKDVKIIRTERGVFYSTGQDIVFSDVLFLMIKDSKWAVLISLLIIFLLVWIDFGKLSHTLMVLTPLISGTMLMLIFLYSFGENITFYNVIVIPLIIGLGVDDGIHIFHRYRQEGKGSIIKTLRTTGHAVLITSVTTFLGFFGLAFSHHQGLQSIGFLAMTGISGCYLTSILLLPALIQFLEDRDTKKKSINIRDFIRIANYK